MTWILIESVFFETVLDHLPRLGSVAGLDKASALDRKTEELAYLAVLAAQRLVSGIPFHVASAKAAGATRAEIISAVLIGLPAVGNTVIEALPVALAAFDGEGDTRSV